MGHVNRNHHGHHFGHVGLGLYFSYGSYAPYYFSYLPSYGAYFPSYGTYAYPSYYDDSYTYAPVYIQSDDTAALYEGATSDVAPTHRPGDEAPDVSTPSGHGEDSIPDGVVVPRPLVQPDEAPEALPREEDEGSAGQFEDEEDAPGSAGPRPRPSRRGSQA